MALRCNFSLLSSGHRRVIVGGFVSIYRSLDIASPRLARPMIRLRRIPVVLSLVAYLFATTVVHALHDHSTAGHCSLECLGPAPSHAECNSAESGGCADRCEVANPRCQGAPSRSDNGEHFCFACRFLAAKSIVAVAVTIIERTEALHQVAPRQRILAPVLRPALVCTRGPPCA
jgi:hypothetical protein